MSEPLVLHSLRIERLPGIDTPFTIAGLSPGLNVIHGPNASGKSSLIRAVERVLWRVSAEKQDATLAAVVQHADARWQLRVDAGAFNCTRNGVSMEFPSLPASERHHRYRLALHDLLSENAHGDEFATVIARESAGGVDLAAAATALGLSDRPSRSTNIRSECDRAFKALHDARNQQAALHAESAQLTAREAQVKEAEAARAELRELEHVHAWLSASAKLAECELALQTLPTSVAVCKADDAIVAEQLLDTWRDHERRRAEASAAVAACDASLEAAFTRTDGAGEARVPSNHDREQWRSELRAYFSADQERVDAADDEAAARDRVEETQRVLAGMGAADSMAEITVQDVEELAALARRAQKADAQRVAIDEALSQLGSSTDSAGVVGGSYSADSETSARDDDTLNSRTDRIRNAMRLLTRWLAAQAEETEQLERLARTPFVRTHQGQLMLFALIPVLCLFVVGFVQRTWFLVAALAAAASVAVYFLGRWLLDQSRSDDMREPIVREYLALRVPAPVGWTFDAALVHLDVLAGMLHDQIEGERMRVQRERLQRSQRELSVRVRVLADEQGAFLRRFGFSSSLDFQAMPYVMDQLRHWQSARAELLDASARQLAAAERRAKAERALTVHCAPFGGGEIQSVAEAEALCADLDVRYDSYQRAQQERLRHDDKLTSVSQSLQDTDRAWRALVARLGLSESPDELSLSTVAPEQRAALGERVAHIVASRALYDESIAASAECERDMARAQQVLDASTRSDEWHDRDIADVEEAMQLAAAKGKTRDALLEQLTRLRQRVEQAHQSHDIERALETASQARTALEAHYHGAVDSMVGHALLRHLQAETRDEARPQVFFRARELFGRITAGAWRLELDDANPDAPLFTAVETRTEHTKQLAQLSGGTRVQLLLAVRVAFVELEETSWKLPLWLDETLGTSDDARAQALIDAVLTLAEEGRQLFYLTAQQDELLHWREVARTRGIAINEVDLSAVRKLPDAGVSARVSAVPRARGVQAVPSTDGHTHASYEAAVGVADILLGRTPLKATPLWYVIDDLPVLHALLCQGIDSWGPLEFLQAQTLELPGVAAESLELALERAHAFISVLEVLHEHAGVGRGISVDRHALVQSPAGNSAYLDELARVAGEVEGDGTAFLIELEAKAVSGFGSKRIAALREWLESEGYLDERSRPSPEATRLAILSSAAQHIGERRIDIADVDAFVARVQRVDEVAVSSSKEPPVATAKQAATTKQNGTTSRSVNPSPSLVLDL